MFKVEFDPRAGAYHRPSLTDLSVVEEVQKYRRAPVRLGDVVLDLGAHIGLAGMYFVRRGARRVICVEADEENFLVLRRNSWEWPRLRAVYGAAVAEALDPYAWFYGMAEHHRSRTSGGLTEVRGRDRTAVPALPIGEILRVKPSVVKMDIEGGEFSVIPASDWAGVRVLVMEVHLGRPEWQEALPGLLYHLEEIGFVPEADPWRWVGQTSGWTHVGIWNRETPVP